MIRRQISARLGRDLIATVEAALRVCGTVNVPMIAEELRTRHLEENIALEDLSEMVMRQASRMGAAMEFHGSLTDA